MKKNFLLALSVICIMQAQATVRIATVNGNWNNTATWGGTVPVANDDVVINPGITVTINVNPVNINNVTINGILQFDATGTGRTWTVNGNLTISSGGVFSCGTPGTATTHTFNYNGTSITNNGSFNLINGSNKCNIAVGGAVAQTIGGSNAISCNKFTLTNTGGKFQILYSAGNFTPTELNPTQLNVGLTTFDSCVIKQGLLIGCALSNSTITHSFATFKMGSATTKITSSVSLSGDATITVNTGMLLNDATNSNVIMNVNSVFMSQSMAQSNAATAFGMQGPNCFGGGSNSTILNISGDWTMTDIFIFAGSTKNFGGTEPNNPMVNTSGNISWASSETHTIDLPFTSNDFILKTCFFGLFDSQGAFPQMTLNGGTVGTPNTFNIAFDVFNAPVQTSAPLGQTTVTQISESMANWTIAGNIKILSGASLAVHSDNTLTVNGTLRIASGGAVAGSETETDSTGYTPITGPTLVMGSSGTIYTENIAGFGKGVLADSLSDVAIKNKTADRSWNLGGAATSGTIEYAATASQTVTDRAYNNLYLGGSGTKTSSGAITINGTMFLENSSTTFADGGFTATCKGSVTISGTHSGSGKIILAGTSNQALSSATGDFGNFEINNAAGATCSSPVTTSGTITFTTGIITTTSSARLILTSTGTYTGSGGFSYVSGPMSKTTASASEFVFPVGKGGTFRQISVIPTDASSNTWTGEYFNQSFSNVISVLSPLSSVSHVEYWNLSQDAGSNNAKVKLYWGTGSGLTDTVGLVVAGWGGSLWDDLGNSVFTGNATAGTITSNPVPMFELASLYTLGKVNIVTAGTPLGSPFCPEESISVPFTSYGSYNPGNVYTAILSDKKGSFSSPTIIGTLASTANAGSIPSTIPSKPKDGTKYRVRVETSNPYTYDIIENSTNFQVIACDKVTGFSTTAITSSSATVNWITVSCAAKYKVQYRKQGTSSWTTKYSTTGSYNITGLLANTVYEYRIQTYCSESGSSKSGFAAIQTFTTTLRLASELNSDEGISMYPNPATDLVELNIHADDSNSGAVKIFNAVGQLMISELISLNEGSNLVSLKIISLPAGVYFVQVNYGTLHVMQKLVKE